MKSDLQLRLSAFDASNGPICRDNPVSNGFRLLCYHCPFSAKRNRGLFCSRFMKVIGARSKYALPAWKKSRATILKRDLHSCVICRTIANLHVHHRDHDPTNDDPDNLVTLCDQCHALVHATGNMEMRSRPDISAFYYTMTMTDE
jgi:hypothetical protein